MSTQNYENYNYYIIKGIYISAITSRKEKISSLSLSVSVVYCTVLFCFVLLVKRVLYSNSI
jgi:hypothetical protein